MWRLSADGIVGLSLLISGLLLGTVVSLAPHPWWLFNQMQTSSRRYRVTAEDATVDGSRAAGEQRPRGSRGGGSAQDGSLEPWALVRLGATWPVTLRHSPHLCAFSTPERRTRRGTAGGLDSLPALTFAGSGPE